LRRYRIQVDGDTCAGSAICAGVASGYFEMGADHVARPIRDMVDADGAVVEAALNCPVDAILVVDADTGDAIPLK